MTSKSHNEQTTVPANVQNIRGRWCLLVHPVGPVGPVGPVDPVGPVGPVGPVDPVDPVDAVGPLNPVTSHKRQTQHKRENS